MSMKSGFLAHCVVCIALTFTGVGCSKPLSTSTIATATGGAIGAGLGALIGSQTGNAGAGLAVGTAAGAGTGALLGNMFEKQEQLVASREEAYVNNQRTIKSQQQEIETLRRLHGDVPPIGDGSRAAKGFSTFSEKQNVSTTQVASSSKLINDAVAVREIDRRSAESSNRIKESSITTSDMEGGVRGLQEVPASSKALPGSRTDSRNSGISDGSEAGDCAQAASEISSAKRESQSKEKLFRYRRALRMCPDKADLHSELGELYLDMNRIHDAEYEFNEAVRLDPNDKKAKSNLAELNG
jgi:hypothetical protein